MSTIGNIHEAKTNLSRLVDQAAKGHEYFNVDAAGLRRSLLSEGFAELPIAPSHVLKVAHLPWHHRDPFDRLLVAQAQVEGITLWAADATLKAYGRAVKVPA